MEIKDQGIKELLENGANLIIYDNHPVEMLKSFVAIKNRKHITIIARSKGVEDLKKVISSSNGNLTFQLDNSIGYQPED